MWLKASSTRLFFSFCQFFFHIWWFFKVECVKGTAEVWKIIKKVGKKWTKWIKILFRFKKKQYSIYDTDYVKKCNFKCVITSNPKIYVFEIFSSLRTAGPFGTATLIFFSKNVDFSLRGNRTTTQNTHLKFELFFAQ